MMSYQRIKRLLLGNEEGMDNFRKVYCIDCEYLDGCYVFDYMKGTYHQGQVECKHDNNVIKKDSNLPWLAYEYKTKQHPSEINKDNDCKWFKMAKSKRVIIYGDE